MKHNKIFTTTALLIMLVAAACTKKLDEVVPQNTISKD